MTDPIISFALVMLLGALSSWYITPETCDKNGVSFELEELAKGRKYREEMIRRQEC